MMFNINRTYIDRTLAFYTVLPKYVYNTLKVSRDDIRIYFNLVSDFSKYFISIPFNNKRLQKIIYKNKINKVDEVLKRSMIIVSDVRKIYLFKYCFLSYHLVKDAFVKY